MARPKSATTTKQEGERHAHKRLGKRRGRIGEVDGE